MGKGLKRLTPAQARKAYGIAWEDLPKPFADELRRIFKLTNCMDLYDSPIQHLKVIGECFREHADRVRKAREASGELHRALK